MLGHTVMLERRSVVADHTLELRFTRPEGFRFRAGQSVDLTLLEPRAMDASGPRRSFTLVGAPSETGLTIATRIRDSAYKRVLADMAVGARADLTGPFGSFALHADRRRPAVFIAGGIGITPFISILRQAEAERLPQDFLVIYANRRRARAAYLDELLARAARDPRVRLTAMMSEPGDGWDGPATRLDEASISAVAAGLVAPMFYAVGPPAMVESVRAALERMGVSSDDLRCEAFSGY